MKSINIRYIVDHSTYNLQFKTNYNFTSFNIAKLKKIIAKDILDDKLKVYPNNKDIPLKSNIENILIREIEIIDLNILSVDNN